MICIPDLNSHVQCIVHGSNQASHLRPHTICFTTSGFSWHIFKVSPPVAMLTAHESPSVGVIANGISTQTSLFCVLSLLLRNLLLPPRLIPTYRHAAP